MNKSNDFEVRFNYIMLALLMGGMALMVGKLFLLASQPTFEDHFQMLGLGLVGVFAFFLFCSGSVYLLARHGYFKRLATHMPTSKRHIEHFFSKNAPSLIILLPSYKEEIPVIRQSLYSSALQAYPNRRVTLLIDNPPDCPLLPATKHLVDEINAILHTQHQSLCQVVAAFQQRRAHTCDVAYEKRALASLYGEIAAWFERQAHLYPVRDHTDQTFVELTFSQRAAEFQQKRLQLLSRKDVSLQAIGQAYCTLAPLFQAEITCFERKKYYNFSHAANKSMNLNSYISVLGKHFKESDCRGRLILEECPAEEASAYFPSSDYICVLDADSVLAYDYAARLVHEMEQPAFANTAVIQTPYTAFPKAPGMLEKMAGATTDIQYMIHQGFTYFEATFWVGANALIRKAALDDIVQHRMENGFLISRYIQDRTVIEDTESSIDLAAKGWKLHNFPDRLSYSATPPDFGSLLIQRKRWANGGLIILPKALRYLWEKRFSWKAIKECFFRIHYLISIPAFLISYALMLMSPIPLSQFTSEIALLSLPYLATYSRDLKLMSYRYSDIFRVIALNTLLIPVNLAGVWQSLTQMLLGKHTKFFRTPKISGLTPVPLVYLLLFLAGLCYEAQHAISSVSVDSVSMTLVLTYGMVKYLDLQVFFNKLKRRLF